MPRFNTELDRQEHLVVSIRSLAMQATTLAVDSMIEAARAEAGGDSLAVAEHVRRLAVGVGFVTGEIAGLAIELDVSTAGDTLVATAGIAITGLQSSLLSIAARRAGASPRTAALSAIFTSADTLRTAALQLDELLPRSSRPSLRTHDRVRHDRLERARRDRLDPVEVVVVPARVDRAGDVHARLSRRCRRPARRRSSAPARPLAPGRVRPLMS